MNVSELKVKNTTICECAYDFCNKDIERIERNEDTRFYGGRITHYSKSKCPKCSKDVILLLKAENNTYTIVDIAEINTKMKNETNNDVNSRFICSKCKNEFKSKSGLAMHQKKCLQKE